MLWSLILLLDNLVWKYSLSTHTKIKSNLLDIIDNYEQINSCPDNVTKTDFFDEICWNPSQNEYFNILHSNSEPLLQEILEHYYAKDLIISNVWFQQYRTNDIHNWHIHGGSNLSLSYMLELPDPKYSTEFVSVNEKKIFQLEDISEGDVIIFPSHVPHRSPLLKSSQRKTTIAINIHLTNPNYTIIDSLS